MIVRNPKKRTRMSGIFCLLVIPRSQIILLGRHARVVLKMTWSTVWTTTNAEVLTGFVLLTIIAMVFVWNQLGRHSLDERLTITIPIVYSSMAPATHWSMRLLWNRKYVTIMLPLTNLWLVREYSRWIWDEDEPQTNCVNHNRDPRPLKLIIGQERCWELYRTPYEVSERNELVRN